MLVGWAALHLILGTPDAVLTLKLDRIHLLSARWAELLPHSGLNKQVVAQLVVLAVGEPAESVVNFAVPGRGLFPRDLLHVFDRVEREVNAERL